MILHQEVEQDLFLFNVDAQVAKLVLAALKGKDDVERALADMTLGTGERISPIYLRDITVSGFRGIGSEATLKIPPGPGLTVVVGRNGSGKSSFAEGLEVLLTGNSYRWEGKAVVWKQGWRNLHHGDNPKLSARFQVEGRNNLTVVERTWSQDFKLESGKCRAQHTGDKISDLDGIGWEKPLSLFRPILSYTELNIAENRPIDLFRILSREFGMDMLSSAMDGLELMGLVRRGPEGEVIRNLIKNLQDNILPQFEEIKDPRAKRVIEYLRVPDWDWDLDSLVNFQPELNTHYQDLQFLMNIKIPDKTQVLEIAKIVNNAYTDWASTEIEQPDHSVGILNLVLEHFNTHANNTCPVCGVNALDGNWRINVVEQIEKFQNYRNAKNNLESAIKKAKSLVDPPQWPDTTIIAIDSLVSIWDKWSSLPDNAGKISEHLLSLYGSVKYEVENISEQAEQIYSEREEKWIKAWSHLSPWISNVRNVIKGRDEANSIKRARDILQSVDGDIRRVRWVSIQKQALDIWKKLRLDSNVDLRSVQLAGARNKRRVDLAVEVDDIRSEAFSVVSQGEISCLALSLFFPRATLPANPFRFLVIDDPIQSMDPARVDGLARVFAEVAESRQLIVFTHDNRLPESLRYLDIKHYCLEVRRSVKSKVTVSKRRDPVIQYFFEARSILKDDGLPECIAKRVIPGFCRSGLEAACVEAVWRRWLGKGKNHQTIEQKLFGAKKLSQKTSLALFDDVDKGGEVFGKIFGKWGKRFAEAWSDANRGTHKKYSADLANLIKDCQNLAEWLRRYDT